MGKYIDNKGREVEVKDSLAQKLIDAGSKLKPVVVKAESKKESKTETPAS
jgi:hypothetical protein